MGMRLVEYCTLVVFILCAHSQEIQNNAGEIWSECSLTCGSGLQYKLNDNQITRLCNTMECPGDAGCLSAYLSFEHVNNKLIFDESKNGNLATMLGTAQIVDKGKFGKALKLSDGGSVSFDVAKFKNRPSLAITIALWVKLEDIKGFQEIFFTCGKPHLYNVGAYHLGVNDGTITWSLKDGDEKELFSLTSDKPMNTSQWYHIAGSYRLSNGEAKLYINGKMNKETKVEGKLKADDNWTCADVGSSQDKKPVQGIIDEFYIFKCALLPQEISELFSKNQFKKFLIPTPNH
ncbi:uncharacterized protein LOC110242504 [Exaiptasia diaphana]|uniref:LamG-like jellyroll fold domain-containing protein n=1 Tax=Exaiptasia diaphana TaxID=2652724 RepID=A0A913XGT6_EXADI|nr:uncharacterized protein LOC110242504 [Exaiptasia diaphana]XP_028515908.1 uncharacterized protein LOC110242504 [Exaiptasia diaphana]